MTLSVWRRRLWLWLAPLLFTLLNVMLFSLYQVGLAGEVGDLQKVLDNGAKTLTRLGEERAKGEAYLARIELSEEAVDVLYKDHFGTEAQRFTRAIMEVKRLARQAGFDPPTVSYPEEGLQGYHLKKRNVVFSVKGSYDQLRTFINFLELTDQFLTLERVSLNGGGDDPKNPVLSINLSVSTVFVDTESGGSST